MPDDPRKPRIVEPGQGRVYPMGRMTAVFKADGPETLDAYSISEWWLQPRTYGAPQHVHDEDHVYYVIAGTLNVSAHGEWSQAAQGAYVLIPGGTPHSFENRGEVEAGFISFNAPGGFEPRVPGIAEAMSAVDLGMDQSV